MTEFGPEELDDWIFDILGPHSVAAIHETIDRTLLDTYVNEALFFWKFLKPALEQHKPARALEVGAGVGLLSIFATTEVQSVTSLEPESSGFGRMSIFRKIILDAWTGETEPEFKECFLHELSEEKTFDFIYCINVLEHVPNPEALIQEIYGRLRPGGMAWFVLPNYSFPYEQHFEIPIILNKPVTERLFRSKIEDHKVFPDPKGLWAELSWPTQKTLSKFLNSSGWSHQFHKTVLGGYFDRLSGPVFIGRKGNLYRALRPLIKLLKPVIIGLPLGVLPIIEFTIRKPGISHPDSFGVEK
jgi:2-polyprenyl-3-methyl-5-hydroxy-6-metoxy-1,4-benzoquinol methylase